MTPEHRKALASIIGDFCKIISCIAVIVVWVDLHYLIRTDQIDDDNHKNGFQYNICAYVAGDYIMDKAIKKSHATSEVLTASVQQTAIDSISDPVDRAIIDPVQTETEILLSQQIDRNKKLVEEIKKEPVATIGWIYVGAQDQKTGDWLSRYFPFEDDGPSVNGQYIATRALNIRKTPPSNASGSWQKGEIIGGLAVDDVFRVAEIKLIPGTHERNLWWVRIIK